MGATELALAKQYYSKPSVMTDWAQMLRDVKGIYSPELDKAGRDSYGTGIMDFEKKVAAVAPEPEVAQDVEVSVASAHYSSIC
jgi:hypothetical protein